MTALDDRLHDAAVAVRGEMDDVAIPEPASLQRGGCPRRPALLALVGAAALVVVISAVVALASRDRHPQPHSQPPSIAAGSALTVADLPAGWKAEPFVENTRPNCLPSFTNTAIDQATRQFVEPSGEILQEIVAYEPDVAHEEFDLASRAMQRCSNKQPDLPAMGDESAAYFVAPVRAPSASADDADFDAAVALVRLGDVRIDVIVFRRHGIDEHTLEPLVRAAVDKVVATQGLKPCALGNLAFDYYGGGGATGNDFGTIRIRNTATLPCLLKGSSASREPTATAAWSRRRSHIRWQRHSSSPRGRHGYRRARNRRAAKWSATCSLLRRTATIRLRPRVTGCASRTRSSRRRGG